VVYGRPAGGGLQTSAGAFTLEGLARDVLTVVLPDDDDDPEPHPWAWLSDLARSRGLDATAADLRGLPYDVVFTEELRRWLAAYREETPEPS
jgi:hypothetical protein